MTTPRPPDPSEPPDARDTGLAARLAVEPLDAETRARLVRTALAGSEHQRRGAPWRALAVAAALLVVLTVGLAVLVPRGGDEDAALRATDSSESEADRSESRAESAPTSGGSEPTFAPTPAAGGERPLEQLDDSYSMGLRDLASIGDLGDVSTPARLRRAVSPHVPTTEPGDRTTGGRPSAPGAACAVTAASAVGTPVAVGTGRIDGGRATVVVVTTPTGATTALALRDPDCAGAVSVVVR